MIQAQLRPILAECGPRRSKVADEGGTLTDARVDIDIDAQCLRDDCGGLQSLV